MTKLYYTLPRLLMFLLLSLLLNNCEKLSVKRTYTVTFKSNEGSAVKTQTVEEGQKVSKPSAPTRASYTFTGWFVDSDFKQSFDFNTIITSDTTLYAKWAQTTFTVTFSSEGDITIPSQSVDKGQKISKPSAPTRTGYAFVDWFVDSDFKQSFDFNTIITSDTTLYAKWAQTTFTVTFSSEGDITIPSQSVDKGQKASKPSDPTRTAYTFGGWYVDSGFQQLFDFANTPITANITLYAKWDRIVYTVIFNSGEGTPVLSQQIDSAQKVSKPGDPKRMAYTFGGWYVTNGFQQLFDFANTPITANITLYAKWDRIVYTVTFNSGEGTPVLSQQIDSAQKVSKPSAPRRTAYTFGGWYADSGFQQLFDFANTSIMANITLYAKWDRIMHTVVFNTGEGSAVPSKRVALGERLGSPEAPKRTAYAFVGWFVDNAFQQAFNFNNGIMSDTILYAKWGPIVFMVTFNSNEGSPVLAQNIDSTQKAKPVADPTREGYTFKGWYADSGFQQLFDFVNTAITSHITLYAKWKALPTYTVTFNSNGGTSVLAQNIDSTQRVPSPENPTRTGYTFGGWYADSGFQQLFDFANTYITGNTTLYAKWGGIMYTVVFNSGGGSSVPSQQIASGDKAAKPTTDPTRAGYAFIGWYKDAGGSQAFDFTVEKITGDITLYAKYGFRIPDDKFREKLQTLVPAAFIGEILDTAHTDVTGRVSLFLSSSEINSSTGIEYFTGLTRLYLRSNSLTSLDVSKNTALTYLYCQENSLTSLDVSKNTALTILNCGSNNLTALDVSKNTALTNLSCNSTSLTSLDVSKNTALTILFCNHSSLTSLDMRGMRSVQTLFIAAGSGGKNLITDLKVHDALKNDAQVKEAKRNRGSALTIRTYSASAGSTAYTVTCNNYDPNQGTCLD